MRAIKPDVVQASSLGVRLQLFPLGTVADAGDQNVRPVSQLFRRIHELTESVCQSVRSRIHGDEPVVVPSGSCAAMLFHGAVLEFESEPDLPDVVYIEQLTSALYLDRRSEVDHYMEVMNRLSADALTPKETLRFLSDLAKQM